MVGVSMAIHQLHDHKGTYINWLSYPPMLGVFLITYFPIKNSLLHVQGMFVNIVFQTMATNTNHVYVHTYYSAQSLTIVKPEQGQVLKAIEVIQGIIYLFFHKLKIQLQEKNQNTINMGKPTQPEWILRSNAHVRSNLSSDN